MKVIRDNRNQYPKQVVCPRCQSKLELERGDIKEHTTTEHLFTPGHKARKQTVKQEYYQCFACRAKIAIWEDVIVSDNDYGGESFGIIRPLLSANSTRSPFESFTSSPPYFSQVFNAACIPSGGQGMHNPSYHGGASNQNQSHSHSSSEFVGFSGMPVYPTNEGCGQCAYRQAGSRPGVRTEGGGSGIFTDRYPELAKAENERKKAEARFAAIEALREWADRGVLKDDVGSIIRSGAQAEVREILKDHGLFKKGKANNE